MSATGFKAGLRRELGRLGSRPVYLVGMVCIPILVVVFFVSLLGEGLPQRLPTSVVDMDQSEMSRQIRRTLSTSQLVAITRDAESYTAALAQVRRGEVYGFFIIPENFQRDVMAGRKPTLEYYTNMTYFVPGTLSFKGFKTVAVTTAGGVMKTTMESMGLPDTTVEGLLTPVVIDINPLNNPWMNYSIYMSPSFSMCTFVLMMMLMSVLSIVSEIKHGTSRQWLAVNGGSLRRALLTKMLPHTVIYSCVGLFILWVYFGWQHFPVHGNIGWMMLATFLLIVAVQAFSLFVVSLVPNPRHAFIICALFGVLSYSFTGFSFPVEKMYGAIAIFSYIAPIRYWYLIFINEALNGVAVYYSRWYYSALLVFPLVCWVLCGRLKKALSNPVYVP